MRTLPLIVNNLSFGINDALQICHVSNSHRFNSILFDCSIGQWITLESFCQDLFPAFENLLNKNSSHIENLYKNSHIENHWRTERLYIEIFRRQELSIDCRSDQNKVWSPYPLSHWENYEDHLAITTWDLRLDPVILLMRLRHLSCFPGTLILEELPNTLPTNWINLPNFRLFITRLLLLLHFILRFDQ